MLFRDSLADPGFDLDIILAPKIFNLQAKLIVAEHGANVMTKTTVLVVGGGIAGPAIALFLKKAGFSRSCLKAMHVPQTLEADFKLLPTGCVY
jgi:NADPH-dependent 2,4-dienoyl-CoA reductase/sulfur reductase-like enzyme